MIQEVGYCPGIENYSRPLPGVRRDAARHAIRFFPDDFLLFVDESHVTVPQIRGMYRRPQPQGRWSSTASACRAWTTGR